MDGIVGTFAFYLGHATHNLPDLHSLSSSSTFRFERPASCTFFLFGGLACWWWWPLLSIEPTVQRPNSGYRQMLVVCMNVPMLQQVGVGVVVLGVGAARQRGAGVVVIVCINAQARNSVQWFGSVLVVCFLFQKTCCLNKIATASVVLSLFHCNAASTRTHARTQARTQRWLTLR